MTIADPGHVAMAAVLRKQFCAPRSPDPKVVVRDLADYDRAFGLEVPS
ncbi:MAG: hypothetical protein ACRDVP_10530 [Acidimicrobiales bacterium]